MCSRPDCQVLRAACWGDSDEPFEVGVASYGNRRKEEIIHFMPLIDRTRAGSLVDKLDEQKPGELGLEELREEITRFRKYVRWSIDLADDAADTEYDEEVSQVMIAGGVYIAPADTLKLCDGCMQVLASYGRAASRTTNARHRRLPILLHSAYRPVSRRDGVKVTGMDSRPLMKFEARRGSGAEVARVRSGSRVNSCSNMTRSSSRAS